MRIAVASFQHETNTFSPRLTELVDYEQVDSWPGLLISDEVCDVLAGLNIASEGFIKAAQHNGHTILPINWCSAEPGGKVSDDAFEKIMHIILEGLTKAAPFDALFLDLHGAMVSESYDDGESEVLRRIRYQFGHNLAIVASLDFHANLSSAFIEQINSFAIYRTYPHLDMADTGARCVDLLEQLHNQEPANYKAFLQIPYLIPLSSQHTGSAPNNSLFEQLAQLEKLPGIHNIEFAMGFPAADIANSGASISVFGSNQQQVDDVCQQFYQAVLNAESLYQDNLMSTAQALELTLLRKNHCLNKAPTVFADVQDNSGAGASSDTTGILADLISLKAKKVIIAVLADPHAVALAHSAVGANKDESIHPQLEISLGGKSTVAGLSAYKGLFEVQAISDGNFTCVGDMYHGCSVKLGPMALLKVVSDECDVQVIVSSERYACTDLAVYDHLGINPLDFDILVVKSTVHFRAAFEPISDHILSIVSPGIHPCQLDKITYKNLRNDVRLGPMGPLHIA